MRPNVRLADRAEAVARRNGKVLRMALPGIAAFGLPFATAAALASGSRIERAAS